MKEERQSSGPFCSVAGINKTSNMHANRSWFISKLLPKSFVFFLNKIGLTQLIYLRIQKRDRERPKGKLHSCVVPSRRRRKFPFLFIYFWCIFVLPFLLDAKRETMELISLKWKGGALKKDQGWAWIMDEFFFKKMYVKLTIMFGSKITKKGFLKYVSNKLWYTLCGMDVVNHTLYHNETKASKMPGKSKNLRICRFLFLTNFDVYSYFIFFKIENWLSIFKNFYALKSL